MPFEVMDQRGASASNHFFEDVPYPTERQIGFWKLNNVSNNQDKLAAASPLEKNSLGRSEQPIPNPVVGHGEKLGISGKGGVTNLPQMSGNVVGHPPNSWSNFGMQAATNNSSGNRATNLIQHESSLFSSSMSEIFSRRLRLGNDILSQDRINKVSSQLDDEPIEPLEEVEAKTIGNLLPDEHDLFSGVTIDELGLNSQTTREDELEDFDLFSMELEGDDRLCATQKDSNFLDAAVPSQGGSVGSLIGKHPYGEHPSRTLFVRNINSNVEDSELRTLFEQYGEIQTLYTACKHRGFVMISYYDIRASRNALRALQNKPLRRRQLDIHYSIPEDQQSERDVDQGTLAVFNLDSSVTADELQSIFGAYGEVKEIREASQKNSHKLIEFYDVRAAEAAFRALNRSDIAGKQIMLEPGRPGGIGRLLPQSEQEQDEATLAESLHDGLTSGRWAADSAGVVASSYMDNASYQHFHAINQSSVSSFIEPLRSSSVPVQLSSPARVAPIGKQYSLRELNQTLEEMKFGNQFFPIFHPHSLPEYHDAVTNGNARNSLDMASSLGIKMTEGLDGRHIRGVASNGHPMEPSSGVFGSSGNGSCRLQANHFIWSNSNSHQQHPPSAMIWPNSPTFVNGIHANHMPHMSAFPRAPPVMVNVGSPVHHIGSAPPVNSPFWDRRHAYAGESPDTSGFHLGSLGSMGFPGSSPSHPVEIASYNIFSHVGGNGMDMSRTGAVHSPQQMSHLFPGRSPMLSMPGSLDNPNERVRTFSHRRNDANSNNADKKQYELDLDRIIRGEDNRTTLMIKNIPNKYTSKMLLAAIDEHCPGTYDFIYLPIDFKNKCNVGYAFINMIDPQQIVPFHKAFSGKKWEKFNSEKVASLAYARIQGKTALIAHFQNSSLMNEDKRCRPILFHTEGPNAGDQEPFPMGSNIRTRPGRSRASLIEESRLGGLSTSGNGEESSHGVDALGSSKDTN